MHDSSPLTPFKVVDQAIQLLSERFTVGLTHKIDESLLMWKADLKLTTRDIIYTSMKASLPHPEVSRQKEPDGTRGHEFFLCVFVHPPSHPHLYAAAY